MEVGHAFEKQDREVFGEEVACRWWGLVGDLRVQHKECQGVVVLGEHSDERRTIGGGGLVEEHAVRCG